MDKYTLELTLDELGRTLIALSREADRLAEIDSPMYKSTRALEKNVRIAYKDAKRFEALETMGYTE